MSQRLYSEHLHLRSFHDKHIQNHFYRTWAEHCHGHSNSRVRGLRVLPFSIPHHIGRCTPSSGGIFGLLYCLLCQLPLSMKQVHSINFLFTVVAALEHNSAKSMM